MISLWQQVTSFQALYEAFQRARKGKRSQPGVAGFEYHLEANLIQIQEELLDGSYTPGDYTSFWIHDPKKRLISAAPFRDRVVHHALCAAIEPLFERSFIYDSYANRVGKGTHRALGRCTQFMRRFAYVLPMDIRQYFPSIDHQILLELLARKIRDEQALALCSTILAGGAGIHAGVYETAYFPGDDLLAALRRRGLPIGNLTSQFWANVYLDGLDHFIKRDLKCRGYLRYVDDLLLFSDSKAELQQWRGKIFSRLVGLRLSAHENACQVRPTRTGIPYLGFQVFPDHRRLKRRKVVHARRRLAGLLEQQLAGRISLEKFQAALVSWMAHAGHGDTCRLREKMCAELGFTMEGEYAS